MSLEQIKNVAEDFISDTREELVVIKGKWGVGKTFFWQKLIEESQTKKCIGKDNYSYVSLFGINNLEELKNSILASRVESNAGKLIRKFDTLTANLKQLAKGLKDIPALRGYTGGLIGDLLFYSLDNTLICFDDLERKGEGLEIRDIFGLASVLKEQRSCKVALIMNDESLEEKEQIQFKLHGEKIIDREIQFSITAEEAFNYIVHTSFMRYDFIKKCCLILSIKNLRILQRIKRFIEDIAPHLRGIEKKVEEDALRTLILYVWSYYDRASNAPSLDFILEFSFVDQYIAEQYKNEKITPEIQKWSEILSSYNYAHTDDVDKCIAEFVRTGYLNKPNFANALNKKNEHALAVKGDESYREVWDIYYRNSFENNEDEFLEELVNRVRLNIPYLTVSDLQEVVTTLRAFGWNSQANALIDEYFTQRNSEKDIEGFRRLEGVFYVNDFKDDHLLGGLREIWASKKIDTRTLADVFKGKSVEEIVDFNDIQHLDSFSAEDYYTFFTTEKSSELYHYVRKCLDLGESAHDTFKSVSEKAKKALLNIAAESEINRMRVTRLYGITLSQSSNKGDSVGIP